jgi:uncharacterized membrane protein YtjA (UPF0391 family)
LLYYAPVALVIALNAAFRGFGGIAGTAAEIAQILFYVFLVIFVVVVIMTFWNGAGDRSPEAEVSVHRTSASKGSVRPRANKHSLVCRTTHIHHAACKMLSAVRERERVCNRR